MKNLHTYFAIQHKPAKKNSQVQIKVSYAAKYGRLSQIAYMAVPSFHFAEYGNWPCQWYRGKVPQDPMILPKQYKYG